MQNVKVLKNAFVTNVYGEELKLEFEDHHHDEEEFEEEEPLTQLTLRIPESYDQALRELGIRLDPPSNRQGAINYILYLYFEKEFSQSSAENLR